MGTIRFEKSSYGTTVFYTVDIQVTENIETTITNAAGAVQSKLSDEELSYGSDKVKVMSYEIYIDHFQDDFKDIVERMATTTTDPSEIASGDYDIYINPDLTTLITYSDLRLDSCGDLVFTYLGDSAGDSDIADIRIVFVCEVI